ncbi:hypothetical protein [Jeotgalibacillus malaysiensis]|uniref:hypothetical protein n=1 Tax=Jeotgalibacillus malaysiensis TaxID=1508404 RepID=UPI00385007F0
MKDAWVLRLKEESKEEDMKGDYYLSDDEVDFLTRDLSEATIISNKDKEIESMKVHEEVMNNKFGDSAVVNFGYTNIMKNFDFVEVVIEEVD